MSKKRFWITAYPIYAVRVTVDATNAEDAIDAACAAVAWITPEKTGIPGAEWIQFTEGWDSFNVADGQRVEWYGPDGKTPLPNAAP